MTSAPLAVWRPAIMSFVKLPGQGWVEHSDPPEYDGRGQRWSGGAVYVVDCRAVSQSC